MSRETLQHLNTNTLIGNTDHEVGLSLATRGDFRGHQRGLSHGHGHDPWAMSRRTSRRERARPCAEPDPLKHRLRGPGPPTSPNVSFRATRSGLKLPTICRHVFLIGPNQPQIGRR